jgi:hypothetical protein
MSWQHEFLDNARTFVASLEGDSGAGFNSHSSTKSKVPITVALVGLLKSISGRLWGWREPEARTQAPPLFQPIYNKKTFSLSKSRGARWRRREPLERSTIISFYRESIVSHRDRFPVSHWASEISGRHFFVLSGIRLFLPGVRATGKELSLYCRAD